MPLLTVHMDESSENRESAKTDSMKRDSVKSENVEALPQRPVADDKVSYLGLLPVFMDITFATYARMLTSPFQGSKRAPNYRRDVSYAALREILSGFSVAEGQKLSPNTDKAYRRVAKSKRWKEHTVNLGNGAKGHWLGPYYAKHIMVYFHGGGYINAATYGHLKYQFALQEEICKMGHDFAIFSLSYTLAPKMVYPGQIAQAASAVRYLIEEQHRDPSDITIAGDSAGGNLTAALLLHISHPHPKIPELRLDKPLRAAIMISPWVCFKTNLPSFTRNKESDYLTTTALDRASSTYIGPGGRHDVFTEPRRAPVEWWADVARTAVQEVFVWGGGGELLIDGIKDFAARMEHGFYIADTTALSPSLRDFKATENGHAVSPLLPDEDKIEELHSARNAPADLRPSSEALPGNTDVNAIGVAVTGPKSPQIGEFNFENDVSHCGTCRCVEVRRSEPRWSREKEKSRGSSSIGDDPRPEIHGEGRVTFVETPRMAHEEMIIDYVLFIRGKREGAKVIERWMDGLLSHS